MAHTTGRHRLARAVLVAGFVLVLMGCGGDVDDSAPSVDGTVETDQEFGVDAPAERNEVSDSSAKRAAFDDAQDLFTSSVGPNYIVTFDLISSATAEAGAIRVEVVDGQVVSADYPDTVTEQVLPGIPMLTVNDFFERARSVLADGGAVEVEFDASYGYPQTMTLDPIPEAIDDEMSIVVRSVEPTEDLVGGAGY